MPWTRPWSGGHHGDVHDRRDGRCDQRQVAPCGVAHPTPGRRHTPAAHARRRRTRSACPVRAGRRRTREFAVVANAGTCRPSTAECVTELRSTFRPGTHYSTRVEEVRPWPEVVAQGACTRADLHRAHHAGQAPGSRRPHSRSSHPARRGGTRRGGGPPATTTMKMPWSLPAHGASAAVWLMVVRKPPWRRCRRRRRGERHERQRLSRPCGTPPRTAPAAPPARTPARRAHPVTESRPSPAPGATAWRGRLPRESPRRSPP